MQHVSAISADRRILAWTAHELGNTLLPLSSAMDVLSTADAEQRAWALGIAKRQLSCMRRLLSDMKEAATRADIAHQQVSREPVVLQELVSESVADYSPIFAARQQHVSSTLEPDELCVSADATRLKQVFSNLLSNATKYTPRGGYISVTCAAGPPGSAEVVVSDDGAGILPENLQRIFEPSYREDSAAAIAPGFGVGLSVASTLVEAHGGCIHAESRGPWTGSRFVVRLPLIPVVFW